MNYLLDNISQWLSGDLGWIYYYVSDSIAPLEPHETKRGILGYKHVILEIVRGNEHTVVRYPFWHRKISLF